MKLKITFLFIGLLSFVGFSQIAGPPACGYFVEYACDDNEDGFTQFNLVELFPFSTFCRQDKGNPEDYYPIVYYETSEDMYNEANPIINPETYTNTSNSQIIYYRANKIFPDSIEYLVAENYIEVKRLSNTILPLKICDDDQDGKAVFDLTSVNVFCGSVPANYTISYYETQEDADSDINEILNPNSYVSSTKLIYIRVEYLDSSYVEITSFDLIVNQAPIITNPTPLEVCDSDDNPDGHTTIYLNEKNDEITNGQSNLAVTYHYTPADADTGTNPITSPYVNTATPTSTVYVRVINTQTGCANTATLDVNITISPTVSRDTRYLDVCDADHDGFANFDLTQIISEIEAGLPNVTTTFHESDNDAQTGTNPITDPNNYQNTNFEEQTIYVRVEDDNTGCASIVPLEIHTNLLLTAIDTGDYALCDNNDIDTDTMDFNLYTVESYIVNDLPFPIEVTFYDTEAERDSNINPIPKDLLFSVISPKVLYIRIENTDTGCSDVDEIRLLVHPILLFNPANPLPYCDTDNDGIVNIDLHSLDDTVTNGNTNFAVRYFSSNNDAQNNVNQLAAFYTNTSNPQTIYARIESILYGCASIASFDLVIQDCRDEDNDGVINGDEDINGNGNLDDDDTDNDGIPDYMDGDDDGDKIDTIDELIDQNTITSKISKSSKTARVFLDTDSDTIENYLDDDDDGDGVLTKDEDYNNNGTPLDDDTNNNNVPDYLEKEVALSNSHFEFIDFSIFPNPTNLFVEIKFSKTTNNKVQLGIYNIQGKLILNEERELQKNTTKLDISNLKSGMYFLKVNDGVAEMIQKLIIN